MAIIANVILAGQVPYIVMLFPLCAVLVLVIETWLFHRLQQGRLKLSPTFWLVAGANVVSWLLGCALAGFIFPTGLVHGSLRTGPDYMFWSCLSFIPAYFLSWLFEYLFLRTFSKRYAFQSLGRSVGLINAASYVALLVLVLVAFLILG